MVALCSSFTLLFILVTTGTDRVPQAS
uniref:Uncharacterized protein n=1 Tax=Arundo donax TaxID=35708 RepID=A0A0A8Y1H2_ARUDO